MIFFSDLRYFRDGRTLDAPGAQGASRARVGTVAAGNAALPAASGHGLQRRRLMAGGAALGLGMALTPLAGRAQPVQPPLKADPAEVRRVIAEFLQGAEPIEKGLTLDMPFLGDNPASVPVRVMLDEAVTPESYCEELILIAEGNPRPLACRFHFTPLLGSVDVGVRLRLIESQSVRALARMNDGRVLAQVREITVTAGGCGM